MHHILFNGFLILNLLGLAACPPDHVTAGEAPSGEKALAEGNTAFALSLYSRLAGREGPGILEGLLGEGLSRLLGVLAVEQSELRLVEVSHPQ